MQAAAGTASGMAGAVVGEMRPHTQPAAEQPRTQQAEKRGGEQVDIAEFHRMSDIYLGGLWNRFEAELRRNEGENFE